VRDANGGAIQDVTVPLTVSGATGTITPGSTTTNNEGRARFDLEATEAGTLTLTAVAGGVTLDQHPTITVGQVGTTTRITSDDPDPSTQGAPVPVTFTVTSDAGAPPGDGVVTVSASDGSPSCSATIAQGTCNITLATAGTVSLTASFAGGGNFSGSSDDESHVVEAPVPPEVSVLRQPSDTATPGVPFERQPEVALQAGDGGSLEQANVAVTADLASSGGTLSGTRVRSTDENGHVEFNDLAIAGPPGTYALKFTANGFAPDTSDPVAVARAATTTTISAVDPEPSEVGQAVTVAFQVTSSAGVPTGAVTVSSESGESCVGTVASGSCAVTLLTSGDHTLTAAYGGDAAFAASQGTVAHHVNDASAPPPAGASTAVSSLR